MSVSGHQLSFNNSSLIRFRYGTGRRDGIVSDGWKTNDVALIRLQRLHRFSNQITKGTAEWK